MKTAFSIIATLAWALWLGGIIAVVLFVVTLFHRDRPLAMQAAPVLFHTFEQYQLVLAAIALVATAGWYISTRRGHITALFSLLALSAIGAAVSPLAITNHMDALRQAGQSDSPDFQRLHKYSEHAYEANALLLLAAGLLLPAAHRAERVRPSASLPAKRETR